jgi:hypothetical protein
VSAADAYTEREGSVMQEYEDFTVEYRDASHRYFLHHGDERRPVPSVTSILKVLDKGALLRWAEAKGAEGAARLARLGELEGVPDEEAIDVVRLFGFGADAARDSGASRGSLVHHMQQSYIDTGLPPKLSDFDPEYRGYVQGYCRWLVDASPEPVCCERIVGSHKHGYAGTLDMAAVVTLVDATGRRRGLALADIKTNARAAVYPEHWLQLLGYRTAWEESTGTDVDGLVVVALGPGGLCRPSLVTASAIEWLNVLNAYRAMETVKRLMKDEQ